jgi:hypothetical protein
VATARINRWWANDPNEMFWLEVSARGSDFGADLNAPSQGEVSQPFWSYDLILDIAEGDVVLHYDRDRHAILAWSLAIGSAWPDTVVWAARGTFARGQQIEPHERPGRRLSLNGPVFLIEPLSLDRIRNSRRELEQIAKDRKYFPFELGSRPTRPLQGYLFKLPAAFLDLFPELGEVPRGRQPVGPRLPSRRIPLTPTRTSSEIGVTGQRADFVPRNEDVRSREAKPWVRDPSEIDRALASHARIERLVAEAARGEGWRAERAGGGDPAFDVLLSRAVDGLQVVVEAKSTTEVNEEKQLRLALGQVLRYRQMIQTQARHVEAMIAVEKEPTEASWLELCYELGVLLAWPATVAEALRGLPDSRGQRGDGF